jgi:hypothetical protein
MGDPPSVQLQVPTVFPRIIHGQESLIILWSSDPSYVLPLAEPLGKNRHHMRPMVRYILGWIGTVVNYANLLLVTLTVYVPSARFLLI